MAPSMPSWQLDRCIILGFAVGTDLHFAPLLSESFEETLRTVVDDLNEGTYGSDRNMCVTFACEALSYFLLFRSDVERSTALQMLANHVQKTRLSLSLFPEETLQALRPLMPEDCFTRQSQVKNTSSLTGKLLDIIGKEDFPKPQRRVNTHATWPSTSTASTNGTFFRQTSPGTVSEECGGYNSMWKMSNSIPLGLSELDEESQDKWATTYIFDPDECQGVRMAVDMLNKGRFSCEANFALTFSFSSCSYHLLYKEGYRTEAEEMAEPYLCKDARHEAPKQTKRLHSV